MTRRPMPRRSRSTKKGRPFRSSGKALRSTPSMKVEETRVTSKHQTTIPKNVRKHLKVRPGQSVRWHVVKEMVIVDVHKKMTNPVKFLTSQVKLDLDLVKLVKETREEFS